MLNEVNPSPTISTRYPIHVFITNVVGCKIEMQMQYSLFFPLVLTFSDKISTFAIDCKLYARLIEKRE